MAVAPHSFFEIAAPASMPAVFAGRREIAVAAFMTPFVAHADGPLEALGIDLEGIGPVVAIDVAADGIAGRAAQHHAAHGRRRSAAAMADLAADDAARDGADDGAGGAVLVVALLA